MAFCIDKLAELENKHMNQQKHPVSTFLVKNLLWTDFSNRDSDTFSRAIVPQSCIRDMTMPLTHRQSLPL
jgi:hypothetical protein